jgi:hypothetical protein
VQAGRRPAALHAFQLRARPDLDPLFLEDRSDRLPGFRLLGRQHAVERLDERHVHPEAGEDLRELGADGAGAEDGQPPRQLLKHEGTLVVQVAALLETRHRRHRRVQAGGEDDSLCLDRLPVDVQGVLAGQHRPGGIADLYPHLLEGRDAEAQHVVTNGIRTADHLLPPDRRLVRVHAVAGGGAHRVGHAGRAHQCLGRHAAVVRAGAADVGRLGEEDAVRAPPGCGERRLGAGGAPADDQEVVGAHRSNIEMWRNPFPNRSTLGFASGTFT